MNNARTAFAAALVLVLALPAFAGRSADDVFGAAVNDINESVAKVVAAQAKRSREEKAPVTAGRAASCTKAEADKAYTDFGICEAAVKKAYGVSVRDSSGHLNTGFARGGFSLVLLTTADAFFYHEDCDICAAVERCSLKDGSLTNLKTAHSVDCGDLAPFLQKGVVTSSCP